MQYLLYAIRTIKLLDGNSWKRIVIRIALKYLVKILDLMDPNDTIELNLKSTDMLEIIRKNESKTSVYKIKLLDVEYTEFDNSQFNLDYDMKLKVNFCQFRNDIKEMMILEAESVTINNSEGKISFVSEGDNGILEIEVNSINSLVKNKYELIKNDIPLNHRIPYKYGNVKDRDFFLFYCRKVITDLHLMRKLNFKSKY